MQQKYQGYRELIDVLKSTCKVLNLDRNSQQHQDVNYICDYLVNPNFQIAVFGLFNHGKSTLLNAMSGNRTLPIDLRGCLKSFKL
jgi:predicted GTPase